MLRRTKGGSCVPVAYDRDRKDWSLLVLLMAMAAYTLLFTSISFCKFQSLASKVPQDMAAHSQAIWNTSRGRFLYQTILYWGGLNHFYPLLALFAPVFWLFHSIQPLLFLYSAILSSGALAVYLAAKELLASRAWALVLGVLYLLFPGVHALNLHDLKPIVLTVPLLLFSYYFWQREKIGGFAIFCLLALMTTEQIAPLILMFAPLSALRRRRPSWILLPLLLALGLLWFAMNIYVPWASGAPYKHIRDHKLLSRLDLFSWESYRHLFSFMGGAAFSLFFSWEALLLGIPYLAFGPIASRIYAHYYYPLVGILFISLLHLVKWIRQRGIRPAAWRFSPLEVLVAALLLLFLAWDPFLERPRYQYRQSVSERDAWALVRKIPEGASVTADPVLLPALSLRPRLHEFARREYHGPPIDYMQVDYILIDPRGPHRVNPYHHHNYPENARMLLEAVLRGESSFEIAAQQGDWVLLRRGGDRKREDIRLSP